MTAALFITISMSPISYAADGTQVSPATGPIAVTRTDEKAKLLAEKRKQITKEAKQVITGTRNALVSLEENNTKLARSQLQASLDKLDILLKKYPSLKLIPAETSAEVVSFDNDIDQVKALEADADELIREQKIQQARHILDDLVSEIRLITVNIPLGSYPMAIKESVMQIDDNKVEEAKLTLVNVLDSLVSTTEVFSLPVLQAESLQEAASGLAHQSVLTKQDNSREILKMTSAAREKLKMAELLGYGTRDDYQSLYDKINETSDSASDKSAVTWQNVKDALASIKEKIARHL